MDQNYYKFELKHIFFAVIGVIIMIGAIVFYPSGAEHEIEGSSEDKITGKAVLDVKKLNDVSKTPKEYYDMFQCSCCGKSIDVGCCGMAKQRKIHVDNLLLEGLEENEIVYEMVKKFGFDVLMDPSREQEIREYIKDQAPENPPQIKIENPKYDFGTIKQSDGNVSTTFTIKNSGSSDLVIENIDTSCMCTSASLTYKGEESPKFSMSMHGNNPENFELKIAPGESAELNVYYDPMAHGIQKKPETKITREVTIISNDPIDFQKKVRIELTQVP